MENFTVVYHDDKLSALRITMVSGTSVQDAGDRFLRNSEATECIVTHYWGEGTSLTLITSGSSSVDPNQPRRGSE